MAKYGLNFISYVCVVVCWIASLSSVVIIGAVKPPADEEKDLTSTLAIYLFRLIYSIIFSGVFSLFAMFGCFVFDEYTNSGLFFLWMWLWMLCAQSIMLLLIGLFGFETFQIFATVFMILMFTSSGAFIAEELSSSYFYYIGRGMPFYYVVRGTRYILFGSLEEMGTNVGVVIAWMVGSASLGLGLVTLRRKKQDRINQEKQLTKEGNTSPDPTQGTSTDGGSITEFELVEGRNFEIL